MNPLYAHFRQHEEQVFLHLPKVQAFAFQSQPELQRLTHQHDPWLSPLCIFLFNTINYCFWHKEEGPDGPRLTKAKEGGSSALLHMFRAQFPLGKDLVSADVHAALDTLTQQLRNCSYPLSLLVRQQTLQALHGHVDATLDFVQALTLGPRQAAQVMAFLSSELRAFYNFDALRKRANLTCHMLHMYSPLGPIEGTEAIPAPIDYHLPNVLLHLGLLSYHPELSRKINHLELLPRESPEEIELRIRTLIACETIAEFSCTPQFAVDQLLWGHRKQTTAPHHLTFTTDY